MPFTIPVAPLVLMSGRILPDSTRALLTTNHGDIILFNIPEDRVEHHLAPTKDLDYLHHIDISPDGTQVLIVYETKTNPPCHIRDLATFDLLHTFDIPYPLPLKAYFYRDNETLLITAGRGVDFYEDGAMVRWDVRGNRELERESYTGIFYDLQRVQDGRYLALLPDGGNSMDVRESFSNKPAITLPQGFNTTNWTHLQLSPDGKRLSACDYGELNLWNLETGAAVYQINENPSVSVFSPDGNRILVGYRHHEKDRLEIRDTGAGKVIHELPCDKNYVIAADWSADSQYALTVNYGETAIFWNTNTWQEVTRLTVRAV